MNKECFDLISDISTEIVPRYNRRLVAAAIELYGSMAGIKIDNHIKKIVLDIVEERSRAWMVAWRDTLRGAGYA